MNLARAIHFDESDMNVYHVPARTGEWCIPGGFEFSDWSDGDLVGKARQAFTNGWLGLDTFGRVTFVAVTRIEPAEREALVEALADHFVQMHGAPSREAAYPVATQEVDAMIDLCDGVDPNRVITVARELGEAGVRETFRILEARDADLAQVAVHGEE
ncbi:hypothetical protein SAMN05444004_101380 [Jannaschia faecimaris]|uniref:Uncharacterized protein n=1 Tax=Jannaschia faecimaris TaxID=1244108 RepID=A0A1H3JLX1_9RHOB|nr:DUF6505 family protein [Jannaschia faecimaris]SDY40990.1 hypothetical protein SAMN05444004_101380 [Jannaschia faecimaris]